ncbi:TrkA family potassium uptake protein [Lacrimispora amygdalina]|uniref:TrkA family potassium uptake protein n=1 Tax=Lacrimispora amygdalina TaxID=253257 RepID=A0A3E2NBC8_9FIRM|nr:NAD-binding protein [Clostridium indicum]RFZ78329.1 TrkA family potassium uptake protein [Clostridium indicum]
MKIAVAGGRDEADFLTGLLLKNKHRLIVINDDRGYCEHLAAKYDKVSVINGDPGSEEILSDAGIRGFDIIIALSGKDADNLEICQMAKRLFSVKKTLCTVRNPRNVEIFKALGVDQVISAAYILAQYIQQPSMADIQQEVKVAPTSEKNEN